MEPGLITYAMRDCVHVDFV